jgi:uncharacterized membrane protein
VIDRNLINLVGLAFGLALAIAMSALFSMAFGYGGRVNMTIDQYGEMWPEMILLWFVVWPTMTVALYQYLQR